MPIKFPRLKISLLVLFSALLVVAATATADTVHLKGGQKLEGKILDDQPGFVEIKTKFGTIKIERARIEKVVYGETAGEEYKRKLELIDKKDADALYELALWCKENKLKKEHRALLKKVLEADPQDDAVNKELGKVKYDGRWFTPSELNAYKKEETERMTAQGMVWYEGQWMPDHEAKKRKGYQLFEGEYISQMDYYQKLGERDIEKTFGYPLTITNAEHFTIRSKNPEAIHMELLDNCELEFEHFFMIFEPDPIEARMLSYYPVPIYILDDVDACDLFIDSGYIRRYNPPGVLDRYAHSTNFSIYFPRPLIVLSEGRHLVGHQDATVAQIGFMSHHIGHILIRRFKCGGPIPGWLEAGIAHYYEGLTNFHQTTSVCEYEGFEDVEKWTDKWSNFLQWRKNLIDSSTHDSLPDVQDLFDLEIETMNTRQMAKAWSVVTFLIKNHREKFLTYIRRVLAPYRGERRLSSLDAWTLGFKDVTPEQIEREWRAWIVEQPPVPQREDRLELHLITPHKDGGADGGNRPPKGELPGQGK